jgi:hypothetical protein
LRLAVRVRTAGATFAQRANGSERSRRSFGYLRIRRLGVRIPPAAHVKGLLRSRSRPFLRRGPADSDCSVVPRLAITLHGGERAAFRVLGEISGVSGAGRRERRSRAAKGVVPGRAGRQHRHAEAADRRRHVEEQSCRGSRMPWIFPGLVTEPRPTLARTTTPGEHERTGRTVRHLPGRVGRMRPHRLRDTAKLQYVEQPLLAPGP